MSIPPATSSRLFPHVGFSLGLLTGLGSLLTILSAGNAQAFTPISAPVSAPIAAQASPLISAPISAQHAQHAPYTQHAQKLSARARVRLLPRRWGMTADLTPAEPVVLASGVSASGTLPSTRLAQATPCPGQGFPDDPNWMLSALQATPNASLANQVLTLVQNRLKKEPQGLSPWMRQDLPVLLPKVTQVIIRSTPDQIPQLRVLLQEVQIRLQRPSLLRRPVDSSPLWLSLARSYHSLAPASPAATNAAVTNALTQAQQVLSTQELPPLTVTASALKLTTTALDLGNRPLATAALTLAESAASKTPLERLVVGTSWDPPLLATLATLQGQLGRGEQAQANLGRLPAEKQMETMVRWALNAQETPSKTQSTAWMNQALALAKTTHQQDLIAIGLLEGVTASRLPWLSQIALRPELRGNFDLWLAIAAEARRSNQPALSKQAREQLLTLARQEPPKGPSYLKPNANPRLGQFPEGGDLYTKSVPELAFLARALSFNNASITELFIADAIEAQKFGDAARHAMALRAYRPRCPFINLTPVPCDNSDFAAPSLHQIIEAAVQARQPQQAIAILDRFQQDSDRGIARMRLMQALFQTKQDAVGLTVLNQIADLNQSTDLSLASLLLRVGRLQEAELILNRVTQSALKLSNSSHRDSVLVELANAYISGNRPASAKDPISRIKNIDLRRSLEEKMVCL